VKKPRIEAKGDISQKIITFFRKTYGEKNVEIIDDDYVNVFETEWYKNISKESSPGKTLRTYRMYNKWTQAKLAEMLDEYKQHVSNMERDRRPITIAMAKKLAAVFGCHYKQFL
jgi:DNA-binding XRE family transcriptional regulator